MKRVAVLGVVALLCTGGAARGAPAGVVLHVNSAADKPDVHPGDGICNASAIPRGLKGRECTLRAAVQETNALGGVNTITVAKASYLLTIPGAGEDASATGDLDVAGDLTIVGTGASVIGNQAGQDDRIFDLHAGAALTLTGVEITNGAGDEAGGAILAAGKLALTDDTVDGATAYGGSVVAVLPGGSLTATRTEFRDNTAQLAVVGNYGGSLTLARVVIQHNASASVSAVHNARGTATITDSLITGNGGLETVLNDDALTMLRSAIVGNSGNGIVNGTQEGLIVSNAQFTLTNSTVVGNQGNGTGGGLMNLNRALLVNDTIAGNSAIQGGGNVYTLTTATTAAKSTIFAGATSGGNCGSAGAPKPISSQGHNLDDGGTCLLSGTGDRSRTDPKLAPPGENGGPTPTLALLAGSPAIDAGDSQGCPATDQRGVTRPTGAGCDIGAYEFAVTADVAVVLTATPAQVTLGQPVTYIAKVTNKGPNPASGVKLTDTLPAGATLVSSTPSAGTCTGRATILCTLGTLADQASATVTIIATPGTAGTARNRVSVQAQQVDPDPTTNTAQAQTSVLAPQTSGGGTQGGSQGGSSALVAKVVALRGRRLHGRARVVAVIAVNRAVTARVTLAFRRRAIAAETVSITGPQRSLTLVAKRKTRAGRYLLRAVLTDSNQRAQTLTVRLQLK